jgi:hypothetical protein
VRHPLTSIARDGHPEGWGCRKTPLVRNAAEIGVSDVQFRLFGHDTPARTVFMPGHPESEAVTDVYVRKDLG